MARPREKTVRPGSHFRIATAYGRVKLIMNNPAAPEPFAVDPDSEFGKALMGAKVGQTVEIVSVRTVTILEIE